MADIEVEIAAYERMQSDLEREHMGKWVVVHDEQLIGAYEDFWDAHEVAVRRFGRGPCLVREVGVDMSSPSWVPPQFVIPVADG